MKHFLSLLAFVIITFATQGTSHMLINIEHYEALGFLRAEPIFLLGFIAMLIQGAIMTGCLHLLAPEGATIRLGLIVSLGFGLFLSSYISFASPAKYAVPLIWEWITVELSVSAIQFTTFGIVLGFIHSLFKAKTRSELKQAL
ncbi:hypothetical protein WH96_01085 [Kiloniella spongiae]|uniref:Uncharacterized protein n=1 Tax=Kiloniella spongiae TaxID=1489064 RepID=A0A0H2MZS0_9PROT|nr:hypothetical protein [Kiloniella spongiae]KLN62160.1 hypothetical protein WH96_01085 [Kiloniella spongiae]